MIVNGCWEDLHCISLIDNLIFSLRRATSTSHQQLLLVKLTGGMRGVFVVMLELFVLLSVGFLFSLADVLFLGIFYEGAIYSLVEERHHQITMIRWKGRTHFEPF